jgi:hypothetical protein
MNMPDLVTLNLLVAKQRSEECADGSCDLCVLLKTLLLSRGIQQVINNIISAKLGFKESHYHALALGMYLGIKFQSGEWIND